MPVALHRVDGRADLLVRPDRDEVRHLVADRAAEAEDLLDGGRRSRPLEEAVLDHPVVVVELRQVRAARVREHHQDASVGAETLRDLDPGPRGRARRAADEKPLLAGETTRGEERVAIGDAHPLVDDGRVERVRPALLADALDEIRPLGMLLVGGEDRALPDRRRRSRAASLAP